jgi:hypothetical protein
MNYEKIPLQRDNFIIEKNPNHEELSKISNRKAHSKFWSRSLRDAYSEERTKARLKFQRQTKARSSQSQAITATVDKSPR